MIKLPEPYRSMPRYIYKGYTILLDERKPRAMHIVCDLTKPVKPEEEYPGMIAIRSSLQSAKEYIDGNLATRVY